MVHDNATNNHGNRCQGSDSENKIDRVFRYTPPARTVLAICWILIINAISTSNTCSKRNEGANNIELGW